MTLISESELTRLVEGIIEDRGVIVRNNPIGTEDEILLWMLLGCLISYLNLTEAETPCFTGVPTAATYREAIEFVVRDRREGEFDMTRYLNKLSA